MEKLLNFMALIAADKTRRWLQALSLLAARYWMAKVFFMAGLTKIDNWHVTLLLFTDEYQVPLLPPAFAALLATAGELLLPPLLLLGLATPLAALGLFMMTLVIELFVYPGTTEHYYWLLLLALLISHGGGYLSLDRVLWPKLCRFMLRWRS